MVERLSEAVKETKKKIDRGDNNRLLASQIYAV